MFQQDVGTNLNLRGKNLAILKALYENISIIKAMIQGLHENICHDESFKEKIVIEKSPE